MERILSPRGVWTCVVRVGVSSSIFFLLDPVVSWASVRDGAVSRHDVQHRRAKVGAMSSALSPVAFGNGSTFPRPLRVAVGVGAPRNILTLPNNEYPSTPSIIALDAIL